TQNSGENGKKVNIGGGPIIKKKKFIRSVNRKNKRCNSFSLCCVLITLYHKKCHVCLFFQAEDGIRNSSLTGVQTCALPIFAIGFAFTGDFIRTEASLAGALTLAR